MIVSVSASVAVELETSLNFEDENIVSVRQKRNGTNIRMTNFLLVLFPRSVTESIGSFRADLAYSSVGLHGNLTQVLSSGDLIFSQR